MRRSQKLKRALIIDGRGSQIGENRPLRLIGWWVGGRAEPEAKRKFGFFQFRAGRELVDNPYGC